MNAGAITKGDGREDSSEGGEGNCRQALSSIAPDLAFVEEKV